jgi:VanZ family protein
MIAGVRHWLWILPAAQMAVIFWASSKPDLSTLPGGVSDKVAHFAAYAALAAFAEAAWVGLRWREVAWRSGAGAIAIAAAYGAFDEVHQAFVPGRYSSFDDWVADLLGALSAVVAIHVVAFALRRLTAPRDV